MTTIFQTMVLDLPPTPLGLLPRRWTVVHHCTVCHSKVATEDLIAHAHAHAVQTVEGARPDYVP